MTRDMTTGSPLRLILAFSLPLMLGSLFQQFYNMADTIIVGRFVSVEALAAVGSTGSLNYLVIGFATGICSGFSIPLAQAFGARDESALRRYTANAVWLTIGFGAVLTVVTAALTRPILLLTHTPADILALAYTYIFTIFAGIPATLLYNMCSAIMRALGDSRHPLYFLLGASVLNVGLDLAFILWFHAGVFGAALATVLSQAVAGAFSLWYLLRTYRQLRWTREEGRPSRYHCLKLCAMGLPMGLQCSITAIGGVVLQAAVNGLGSAIVAAQTAGSRAGMILTVPLESLGTAMTTFAGQNQGARRLDRVRTGVSRTLALAAGYSVLSFAILHFADRLLIGLFVDPGETQIIADAQKYLFWNSVFYLLLGTLIIYRYTLQGLGFSTLAMFAGVAEMAARALVGFVFVAPFGYIAACVASPAAWLFACVFLFPAYHWALRRLEAQFSVEQAARSAAAAPDA
jgi:putative MATE family efflux protein